MATLSLRMRDDLKQKAQQLAKEHAAWEKTLVPVGEIPKIAGDEPLVPKGHGWASASAKDDNKTDSKK